MQFVGEHDCPGFPRFGGDMTQMFVFAFLPRPVSAIMVELAFGQRGDELHDLGREFGGQRFERVIRIFDNIVQQRGGENFVVVDAGSEQDHRRVSWVCDVRQIAPLAVMMPMRLGRDAEGAFD